MLWRHNADVHANVFISNNRKMESQHRTGDFMLYLSGAIYTRRQNGNEVNDVILNMDLYSLINLISSS